MLYEGSRRFHNYNAPIQGPSTGGEALSGPSPWLWNLREPLDNLRFKLLYSKLELEREARRRQSEARWRRVTDLWLYFAQPSLGRSWCRRRSRAHLTWTHRRPCLREMWPPGFAQKGSFFPNFSVSVERFELILQSTTISFQKFPFLLLNFWSSRSKYLGEACLQDLQGKFVFPAELPLETRETHPIHHPRGEWFRFNLKNWCWKFCYVQWFRQQILFHDLWTWKFVFWLIIWLSFVGTVINIHFNYLLIIQRCYPNWNVYSV